MFLKRKGQGEEGMNPVMMSLPQSPYPSMPPPPMYMPPFFGTPGITNAGGSKPWIVAIPALLILILSAVFALWYKGELPAAVVEAVGSWASGPTVPASEADALA
jgi:hypothetical protein